MKKFKKLTLAAVSVVMAGTLAVSFAACGGGGKGSGNGGGGGGGSDEKFDYYGVLNEDGSLNYDTYQSRGNVTLNIAIGYQGAYTSTTFSDFDQSVTLPDGVTYDNTTNKVKPAWVQMGQDLNITWNDVWDGTRTANNIASIKQSSKGYDAVDVFTTDISAAEDQKANYNTNILNLGEYLNRMPNFKNFLSEYPTVYLSILQSGMNTTNGSGQTILVAPYFDGVDDIERYCIIRQDWAEKLLNGSTAGATSTTFASECGSVSAKSFMGSADYTMDALNAAGTEAVKVKKNYTKVLAEVKGSGALATAYKAIDSAGYTGDSGNIVDIMNAALTAKPAATGAELLNLFRAYIEVAFTTESGTPIYTAATRANLFNGYDACWDVDDLVAMLRCVKTNASVVSDSDFSGIVGGIASRDGNADRLSALVSLACQLYGVRGGTSRYEYTYIDSAGNIKDARNDVEFYKAMVNMHDLFNEGLIADFTDGSAFVTDSGIGTAKNINENDEYFMVYDYLQTQTKYGFYAEGLTGIDAPGGYKFAPILTPVSKWDENGDGQIGANEYFRFTESWRSTKTSGLAVNGKVADDEKKLEAVLEFIDYLYSEDGQIVSTFGPMADENGYGGFWHNDEATTQQITDGKYFTYKGKKYSGTDYKDKVTPTVTDELINSFKGKSTHDSDWKIGGSYIKARLSFTDYARYFLGATLPLGVKNQSFENQLTSNTGKLGAEKVRVAIEAGVVRGMSLKIDDAEKKTKHSWYTADNYWWYTCVPSGLPITSGNQVTLRSDASHKLLRYVTGEATGTFTKDFFSLMVWIMVNGTSGTFTEQNAVNISFTSVASLGNDGNYVSGDIFNVTLGEMTYKQIIEQRIQIFEGGWNRAKNYWNYLKTAIVNE